MILIRYHAAASRLIMVLKYSKLLIFIGNFEIFLVISSMVSVA